MIVIVLIPRNDFKTFKLMTILLLSSKWYRRKLRGLVFPFKIRAIPIDQKAKHFENFFPHTTNNRHWTLVLRVPPKKVLSFVGFSFLEFT